MRQINLKVTDVLYERIKKHCYDIRTNQSEFIREAIVKAIKEHPDSYPGIFG